jgi:type II restriction/modification system DNA methylase subunit YeeA
MNTKNLKAYAPKARSQFIEAIKKRAAQFGLYQDKIVEMQSEGSSFIIEGRAFSQKQGQQRQQLERKINGRSQATHTERYNLFIREMAYTWFNRLAAIRYMELHDYLDHGFRVLSNPNNPESLPEILDHASDVVDSLDPLSSSGQGYLDKNHIVELQLAGNKEEELYRELLLGQCHYLYKIMPFMFEQLDDASELLLPDNLTKTDSILKGLVNDIPEEDWNEIEVIGWLYQFYISEHKDSVIGKVVKSEDIPAATQLFTPNWIVKYLVQNSLGRQWLATYPESELKGKMEYYIEPAEQSDDVIEQLKAITPTSINPEEIKVLDPAAGSGHILVEVYDVLREIYLERGYRLREIPELILTKNIYGLDIDDRAAQLAGFALMMKAREDDRRIFQRVEDGEVALNIYSMQSSENLDIDKLWQALNLEGKQIAGSTGGLFDEPTTVIPAKAGIYKDYFELLQILKASFLQAKTLGSLIQIDNNHLQNLVVLKELLQVKENGSDPSAKQASNDLLPIINQALVLAQQYDVVVANPPYIGNKYQTSEVKKYLKDNFSGYEKDLFSAFIFRNLQLTKCRGDLGFMTPFVWMIISSYEKLRENLIKENVISTLVQLEYSGFEGATVPICTFTLTKGSIENYKGSYIKLTDFKGAENQPIKTLEAINTKNCEWLFTPNQNVFNKIPGSLIAYWLSDNFIKVFETNDQLQNFSKPLVGLQTSDNDRFLRYWYEVSNTNTYFNSSSKEEALVSGCKWFPHIKGGGFRKWYGYNEYVINWENDGDDLKKSIMKRLKANTYTKEIRNEKKYFKSNISWGLNTSNYPSFRFFEDGGIFNIAGPAIYPSNYIYETCAFLNSTVSTNLLLVMCPTINFTPGDVAKLPFNEKLLNSPKLKELGKSCIDIAKSDWNSRETSWGFKTSSLLKYKCKIKASIDEVLAMSEVNTRKLQALEKSNNEMFIEAFNLDNDFVPDVDIENITLHCNVHHRFSEKSSLEELNSRYVSELSSELISYSMGCMMGRFSLDVEGLLYAEGNNDGFNELISEGVYQNFPVDDDGIVPLASENWLFGDDATARFREFVKTVWGDENLQENLEFVAESLCLHALNPIKGESANDTVRRYFSKQFYKDHCKTYKKRPIYWLFSSGKERAFECLVYLHRYNEGTLARMRTEYVTPLMGKYDQQQSMLSEQIIEASNTEKRQIEKDLKSLEKKQAELRTFDEQLKHYAEMRITLDLDDGVKANYGKFGNLLADVKAIHGKLPEKAI